MNFLELQQLVAENINYLDVNDNIVSRDVSQNTIKRYLNRTYIDVLFPLYANIYPEYYTQPATMPTYHATGTVSTSSTGYTLIANSAIFSDGMIGAKVYNATDGAYAIITDWTSDVQVTLDTQIDDTWDGDTIYVFTGIYFFGGDATGKVYRPEWVGIKYDTNKKDYQRADSKSERDVYARRRGTDHNNVFSQLSPIYMFSTYLNANEPSSAVTIQPKPLVVIEDGVFIEYIRIPDEMVGDADEPRVPKAAHNLIALGATVSCLMKMKMYGDAREFENKYNKELTLLRKQYPAERKNRTIDFMGRQRNSELTHYTGY